MTTESRESIVRALRHLGVDVNAILPLKPTDEQLQDLRIGLWKLREESNPLLAVKR
jgi:hypothetical protein